MSLPVFCRPLPQTTERSGSCQAPRTYTHATVMQQPNPSIAWRWCTGSHSPHLPVQARLMGHNDWQRAVDVSWLVPKLDLLPLVCRGHFHFDHDLWAGNHRHMTATAAPRVTRQHGCQPPRRTRQWLAEGLTIRPAHPCPCLSYYGTAHTLLKFSTSRRAHATANNNTHIHAPPQDGQHASDKPWETATRT